MSEGYKARAWNRGYEAGLAGEDIESNPYVMPGPGRNFHAKLAREWREGWAAAIRAGMMERAKVKEKA